MTLKLIAGPAIEPVSLAEAKVAARIDPDVTAFDAIIPGLIVSARRMAEQQLERALITQTWERTLDEFPEREIELGMPIVQGILSVSYINTSGVDVGMQQTDYALDNDVYPGWVFPATDWPATYDTVNAVRVRYLCGYGENASAVPEEIRTWIKAHVSLWLRQVEAASDKPMTTVPYLDHLLDRERWLWR